MILTVLCQKEHLDKGPMEDVKTGIVTELKKIVATKQRINKEADQFAA